MKCILSAKQKSPNIVIHHISDVRSTAACISSVFLQTVLPNTFVVSNSPEKELIARVRYYNDDTAMNVKVICSSVMLSDSDLYDDRICIHIFDDTILDREYIERTLKKNCHTKNLNLSPFITKAVLSRIEHSNTMYIDVFAMIPIYVRIFASIMKAIYSVCHLNKHLCINYKLHM